MLNQVEIDRAVYKFFRKYYACPYSRTIRAKPVKISSSVIHRIVNDFCLSRQKPRLELPRSLKKFNGLKSYLGWSISRVIPYKTSCQKNNNSLKQMRKYGGNNMH